MFVVGHDMFSTSGIVAAILLTVVFIRSQSAVVQFVPNSKAFGNIVVHSELDTTSESLTVFKVYLEAIIMEHNNET